VINKILFLTVATQSSGLGHLMRSRAISEALEDRGIKTHFIVDTEYNLDLVKPYEKIDWVNELSKIVPTLKEYLTIIVDTNNISEDILSEIQNHVKTLVFIDDYYRWIHNNRMIIDWTVTARKKGIHNKRDSSEYLLGPKYTALRREFWENRKRCINENIDNVLITFGGSDIRNLTPLMMRIIKENFPGLTLNVIVGRGFSNNQEIEAEANDRTNLIFNPDAESIKKIMMTCDIAIASGGQTLYELACVGLPTIAITMIDNQVDDTMGFHETGFLFNAGWWNDKLLKKNIITLFNSLLDDTTRKNMSIIGQKNIDGKGTIRIAKSIVDKIR
jgi:UDP-2,4-diacetamido-2,4,6-trideoxy-beta-L-altropyranose hydrolase